MSRGRPSQIPALTTLRGLFALWVVVFHFWNDIVALLPDLRPLEPLAIRGNFAVPGFFVLSGFVLARNHLDDFVGPTPQQVMRFLGLRLFRIYPVHLATLLTVVGMVIYAHRAGLVLDSNGYTRTQFALNLALAQTWPPHFVVNWNFPAWSISSEWFAYLLFPWLAWGLVRRVRTVKGLVLAFGIAIGATIAADLGWGARPFWGLVVVVPPFIAGMFANSLAERLASPSSSSYGFPEACGVLVILACLSPGHVALAVLLATLPLLVLGLGVGRPVALRFWELPALLYLGQVSYSLYMTHTLVLKLVKRLLPSAAYVTSGLGTRLGVLMVYTLLIFLGCWASYSFVEAPVRRASQRWLRPRLYRADSIELATVGQT